MMDIVGGLCFAHGEYTGRQCPQWPKCATDPQPFKPKPEPREPAARELFGDEIDESNFARMRGEIAELRAEIAKLQKDSNDNHTKFVDADAAAIASEASLLQARQLLTEQTCSIANCGHADCNKIMEFLASTSAPEGE